METVGANADMSAVVRSGVNCPWSNGSLESQGDRSSLHITSDTYKFWPLDASPRQALEVGRRYTSLGLDKTTPTRELWV